MTTYKEAVDRYNDYLGEGLTPVDLRDSVWISKNTITGNGHIATHKLIRRLSNTLPNLYTQNEEKERILHQRSVH